MWVTGRWCAVAVAPRSGEPGRAPVEELEESDEPDRRTPRQRAAGQHRGAAMEARAVGGDRAVQTGLGAHRLLLVRVGPLGGPTDESDTREESGRAALIHAGPQSFRERWTTRGMPDRSVTRTKLVDVPDAAGPGPCQPCRHEPAPT